MRDKLRRDIDAHVAAVRAAKLSDLTTLFEVCTAAESNLYSLYLVGLCL